MMVPLRHCIKSISIILIFHFFLLPPPTPINTLLFPTSFYSFHVMCMCLSVCLSMSLIRLVYRNMGKGSYTGALTTYSGYSLPQSSVN